MKWSWLLWFPLAIAAIPLFLFVGPVVQTLLMGPVNIWNSTKHAPSDSALAGYYKLSETDREKLRQREIFVSAQSGFELGTDHTLQVTDLPSFDGFGKDSDCHLNGTGSWVLDDSGGEIELTLNIDNARPADKGNFPSCG